MNVFILYNLIAQICLGYILLCCQ